MKESEQDAFLIEFRKHMPGMHMDSMSLIRVVCAN